MRAWRPVFKSFVAQEDEGSVTIGTDLTYHRLLALAACLLLGACNLTTSATTVPAQAVASTEAGGAQEGEADLDVVVPDVFLFIGQNEDALNRHFGAPDLTRREGEATVHQYKTNARRGPMCPSCLSLRRSRR